MFAPPSLAANSHVVGVSESLSSVWELVKENWVENQLEMHFESSC